MDFELSPTLTDSTPVYHGGPDAGFLKKNGVDSRDVLDFSVCLNPFPLPSGVETAIREADPLRYPDPRCRELLTMLAEVNQTDSGQVLVVNGVSQGIFLLAFCLLKKNDTAIIINPDYGEYEKASRLMGARILPFSLGEKENFYPRMDKLISLIEKSAARALWICNPNNPTGILLGQEDMEKLQKACYRVGTFLLIDEAYINFVSGDAKTRLQGENIIILRSMTKDFTLPGLRLGYVLAHPNIIRALSNAQPEWSMNSPALAAGKAVLACYEEYRKQWIQTDALKNQLAAGLESLQFKVFPGTANFLLIKDETRGGIDPVHFGKVLWKSRILVRDCTSFGLPGFIRLGVSTAENNKILLDNLARRELWEN